MLLIGEGVEEAVCSGQGVEVGEHQPIREARTGTLKFEAAFVENLRGKIEVSREPAWVAGKNLGMRGQEKQEKEGKILRHARDLVAWRGCGIKLNRVGYHFRSEQSYWSVRRRNDHTPRRKGPTGSKRTLEFKMISRRIGGWIPMHREALG